MTDPFAIAGETTASRVVRRVLSPALSGVLGLPALRRVYADATSLQTGSFLARALQVLAITVDAGDSFAERIPPTGPLIIVANHPHGALDGLALGAALLRVRPDTRLLANHLLSRIPEMRDLAFFVDPFAGPTAAARSRAGLRAAHLWLRRGGALVVFPAGEVAHRHAGDRTIDGDWLPTVGRLALHTSARVLPVFIPGRNSRLFRVAGSVHPRLRTALLGRELLGKQGSRVRLIVGEPLDPPTATDAVSPERVTRRLRAAVDQLSAVDVASRVADAHSIAAEVDGLPESARLAAAGAFQVFSATASEIPRTLLEIGRLRAEAYRAAGEGSDAAIDLDAFDRDYLHLFVWDAERRLVVGAYRMGLSDRLLASRGVEGLYTRTLFEYGRDLLARMPPAIELGRAFVRLEYQRQHQPLMLLWKGIGQFVVRNPHYRALFGPVSISARYSDSSQALLASFLEINRPARDLSPLVRPLRPFMPPVDTPAFDTTGADDIDRQIAALEPDGKGMPVLLRQYLRLNARALAFSVDHEFGGVLDALMVVDLPSVEPAILRRYLGAGASSYLAHHKVSVTRAA